MMVHKHILQLGLQLNIEKLYNQNTEESRRDFVTRIKHGFELEIEASRKRGKSGAEGGYLNLVRFWEKDFIRGVESGPIGVVKVEVVEV